MSAGREKEIDQFRIHMQQDEILKNVILTGLRGTGKTVLMDSKYKYEAQRLAGFGWGPTLASRRFSRKSHFAQGY